MSRIRLEQQRRLTLPSDVVEQAGIHLHDLLEATYENGAIVLRPLTDPSASSPAKSIMDYAGACEGTWGKTPEEVEANLVLDRESWDR